MFAMDKTYPGQIAWALAHWAIENDKLLDKSTCPRWPHGTFFESEDSFGISESQKVTHTTPSES